VDVLFTTLGAVGLTALATAMLFALAAVHGTPLIRRRVGEAPSIDRERRTPRHRA
jgi:hypothetical protein